MSRYFFGGIRIDPEIETDTLEGLELILLDNKILSVKKFFEGTKVVKAEYTYFAQDTFVYSEYDSLEHKLLARGKKVFTIYTDTSILVFNPDTFEDYAVLNRDITLSKEGEWFEIKDNKREHGVYQNGIRVGQWLSVDYKLHKNYYLHYAEGRDTPIIEPFDLLETKNPKIVEKGLLGQWKVRSITADGMELEAGSQTNMGLFVFDVNQFYFTKNTIHSPKKEITGSWFLSGLNRLVFEAGKLPYSQYEIESISPYEIILRAIKN